MGNEQMVKVTCPYCGLRFDYVFPFKPSARREVILCPIEGDMVGCDEYFVVEHWTVVEHVVYALVEAMDV